MKVSGCSLKEHRMGNNGSIAERRTVYVDYLRVSASIAVMILHISGSNWHSSDVNGFVWQTFNFFDSMVRWGVPAFVMISGALFLGRSIPLERMYKKYILRLVAAFCIWSLLYALLMEGNLSDRVKAVIQGHYHMWYIFMIIGLYMCLPFIKPVVENERRTRYFLLLALIFNFAVPEIMVLADDFGSGLIVKGAAEFSGIFSKMRMNSVLGFSGYFVLGYYLNRVELTKKQRIIVYILGVIGFAATIGLSLLVSLKLQKPCEHYYDSFRVNVLPEAVAVFVWFKSRDYKSERLNRFVRQLAKYSFGAYLVHPLVIDQLNFRLGLNTLSFNPILSVACISLLVFAVSFAVSAILNHIPAVNRYMV